MTSSGFSTCCKGEPISAIVALLIRRLDLLLDPMEGSLLCDIMLGCETGEVGVVDLETGDGTFDLNEEIIPLKNEDVEEVLD